jgi:hypothetical protein
MYYIIMNKLIKICLSYYNQRKQSLIRHILHWKEFPLEIREQFTFFIIDDSSKICVDTLIEEDLIKGLDLHLYRVKQDLYCNIAGVRNLGASECKTPYMMIIDMDTVISPIMSKEIIDIAKKNKNNNLVFKFNRYGGKKSGHMHPAVCLIRKEDYWNIGGCEEDLVGHYGYTDPSFWFRATGKVDIVYCNTIYLLYFEDGESDINRDRNHNKNIFQNKKLKKDWSTDYIRFDWEKIK